MSSSGVVDREAIIATFDALDVAFDKAAVLDCEALATRELLASLERTERLRRRIPAIEHPMINALGRQATPEELGGKLSAANGCRRRWPPPPPGSARASWGPVSSQ
jgi:hypothetical protein